MSAGIYNITIEQGSDYVLEFVWRDADGQPRTLTDWSGKMQVRADYASATKIFDLSTENGRIQIDGAAGRVSITIPAELSRPVVVKKAELSWQDGKQGATYAYDLELFDSDGRPTRLLQGAAFFVPEVTK